MENTANEKNYVMSTIGEFFGDYTVTTVDEYFEILDREAQKRSKMVAKSLTKYLQKVQANTKYDELKINAIH